MTMVVVILGGGLRSVNASILPVLMALVSGRTIEPLNYRCTIRRF